MVTWQRDVNGQRRDYVQKQMLLLMLSTVVVFLFTTLPLAVTHVIGPLQPPYYEVWKIVYSVYTATTCFLSLSYSVCYYFFLITKNKNILFQIGFYIRCLTSKSFRTEFTNNNLI